MVWVPIKGYVGYEVSDCGQVRTYRPKNGRGPLVDTPRLMRQDKAKGKTYWRVALSGNDGRTHYRPVHQLVATAFHGDRPSGTEVRHLDGNSENNRSTNLCWGTTQENADDRLRHGTQVRGEQVSLYVLTEARVAEVKAKLPTWKRGDGRMFARKFGVGDSAISAIKKGHTWR